MSKSIPFNSEYELRQGPNGTWSLAALDEEGFYMSVSYAFLPIRFNPMPEPTRAALRALCAKHGIDANGQETGRAA